MSYEAQYLIHECNSRVVYSLRLINSQPGLLKNKPRLKKLLNPSPKRQILDSSKLKEFVNDNLNFDENGGKFSKRVKNTVGKGEIARYEQFLLFPWCFQDLYCRYVKPGLVWEKVIEGNQAHTKCKIADADYIPVDSSFTLYRTTSFCIK